jgi:predicted DNA-binding protein
MGTMVRKQIYIRREQEERLKQKAAEMGRSEAEIIRDAIDESFLERHSLQRATSWAQALEFIDGLIAQGPVPGGRTWTREELYER